MADKSTKKGKKNRKYGRNGAYCQMYRLTNKRERNKLKKLKKHLEKFPDDKQAQKVIKDLR